MKNKHEIKTDVIKVLNKHNLSEQVGISSAAIAEKLIDEIEWMRMIIRASRLKNALINEQTQQPQNWKDVKDILSKLMEGGII
jgi:hypothetical protein